MCKLSGSMGKKHTTYNKPEAINPDPNPIPENQRQIIFVEILLHWQTYGQERHQMQNIAHCQVQFCGFPTYICTIHGCICWHSCSWIFNRLGISPFTYVWSFSKHVSAGTTKHARKIQAHTETRSSASSVDSVCQWSGKHNGVVFHEQNDYDFCIILTAYKEPFSLSLHMTDAVCHQPKITQFL